MRFHIACLLALSILAQTVSASTFQTFSPAEPFLVITTTDFSSGSLATLAQGQSTARTNILNIHSDAVATYYQGNIYVINRLGQDNVIVLDAADPGVVLRQFSVGNGANPQDIAFVSPTKAYVSLQNSSSLLIVDPSQGRIIGSIDLSGFADADGLPEAGEMEVCDGYLYVACNRLDRSDPWNWLPTEESPLVVVDTASDSVVDVNPSQPGAQGISLELKNPVALVKFGDKLYLSCTGSYWDMTDGGIEMVDPSERKSKGILVGERDLGGNVGALSIASPDKGYCVVLDASWNYSLVAFHPDSRSVLRRLEGVESPWGGLAVLGDHLYVGDRSVSSPGVIVYDTATDVKVMGPVSTGLPPGSIAVVGAEPPTAVEGEEAVRSIPLRCQLIGSTPNPFNPATTITYAVGGIQEAVQHAGNAGPEDARSAGYRVELGVYDGGGRMIRRLVPRTMQAPGEYRVVWDGRDREGRQVPSGVYLVRLGGANEGQDVRKITLLR